MPADGYTAMFERILDHPLIEVRLGTDYDDVARRDRATTTSSGPGPIDEFFDYRFGALPYRSLEFELANEPTPDGGYLLPAASVNEPSEDVPYTRTHGVPPADRPGAARLTRPSRSSTRAPRATRTTRSPATTPGSSTSATRRWRDELADVTFVGRLARYQYLNMDQVVGQALSTFERMVSEGRVGAPAR